MSASASGRWLPCVAVAACCRRIVVDIEAKRQKAVDALVAPLMLPTTSASWWERLLAPAPCTTRAEALERLRDDTLMSLHFAETKHAKTWNIAVRLLQLSSVAAPSTDIFVTADDFDHLDYMWASPA